MKGGAEGIPNDLEDISAVTFDRLAQYGMMARQRLGHNGRIMLPELRATLNIGEQESDSAGGPVRACHVNLGIVSRSL